MMREEKIQQLADIIAPIAPDLRGCDCTAIAKKLIDLNYGDVKQTALDFYTAVSLALADGVKEYIIGGKKVLLIKAGDMQAYFDETAKSYGIEQKNG